MLQFLHQRSSICCPLRLPFGFLLWWWSIFVLRQKQSHCLRQPYLSTCYSTLLVYLVTCYLFYLSTCLLATCSTWIYMLLYPSLKCPRLFVWRGPLYSYYTMLPHPAVSACLVHCYTLPAQYIYCNRPS